MQKAQLQKALEEPELLNMWAFSLQGEMTDGVDVF